MANKLQFRMGTSEERVWRGKPTAPTINYFGPRGPEVAPEAGVALMISRRTIQSSRSDFGRTSIWHEPARADRLEACKKKDRRARRHSSGGRHGPRKITERERQSGPDHHRRSRHAAALCAARQPRAARSALRLRACAMWRLHGPRRRQGGALMRHAALVAHRPAQ